MAKASSMACSKDDDRGNEELDQACVENVDRKPSLLDLDVEPLFYGVGNSKHSDQTRSMMTPPLFDASSVLKESDQFFAHRSSAFVKSTEGEDVVEMAVEYASKISAYPHSVVPIGIILSPSIIRDFQVDYTADSLTRFSRVENIVTLSSFRLPYRPHMLLTVEAKEAIDTVQSLDDAERVLLLYGVGFFQRANFGAAMTCSARSSNIKTATDLSRTIEGVINNGEKRTTTTTYHVDGGDIEYWVQARGGIPGLILEGKEIEWMESVDVNQVIVEKTLAPLSDLAIEGSKAEAMLHCAIQRRCRIVLERFKTRPVFPGPGMYYIRAALTAQGESLSSDEWYLHASHTRDVRGSRSTWVTCSKEKRPMVWNVVPASQEDCETYYILTTRTREHKTGCGLNAACGSYGEKIGVLRGRSERSDGSTWIHAHKHSFSEWRIESSGDTFRVLLAETKNKMKDWRLAVDLDDKKSPTGNRRIKCKTGDRCIKSYVMCHDRQRNVPQSFCAEWIFEKV